MQDRAKHQGAHALAEKQRHGKGRYRRAARFRQCFRRACLQDAMQHVESKAKPELHRGHRQAIRGEGCPHQADGQQHAAQGQQALFAKARHQGFRKPRIGEGTKPKTRHHQPRQGG